MLNCLITSENVPCKTGTLNVLSTMRCHAIVGKYDCLSRSYARQAIISYAILCEPSCAPFQSKRVYCPTTTLDFGEKWFRVSAAENRWYEQPVQKYSEVAFEFSVLTLESFGASLETIFKTLRRIGILVDNRRLQPVELTLAISRLYQSVSVITTRTSIIILIAKEPKS